MCNSILIVFIVGVVSISKKELKRLPGGTAVNRAEPNTYVVELEMFHQLHCLVSVRATFLKFVLLIRVCIETTQKAIVGV
jgi:hypothetical protein